jgi:methylmalonyl-CoA mutase
VKDAASANTIALNVLMRGADSIGFVLETDGFDNAFFNTLLKEIDLTAAEVNFTGKFAADVVEPFMTWAKENNADTARVSFDVDPLGCLNLTGAFDVNTKAYLASLIEIANGTAQCIAVHGDKIHNAGSTIIQELGLTMAMAVEYLEWLAENGVDVKEAAANMRFVFAVGSNYFMELAKMRAARTLWAQILKAYGIAEEEQSPMVIHGVTSDWNKTVYDPYVNMLRTTTEAMSGILGGVDSFTVKPFDVSFREPNEFSNRIARNQQLLLKEESYFDKVADPAAGSYYIENLTNSIMENAWKIFLGMQEKDGYLKAFLGGDIQAMIAESAQKRDMNIATRRENVLGTNQFPNFGEMMDENLPEEVLQPKNLKAENAVAEPLTMYRGSMPFEVMRSKSDRYARENGRRQKAFMLTIGNLAMRKARAQFACNFFACAGYDVVDNNGFTNVEDGVKAALEAKSDIVVICSSDDEYAEFAPQAAGLLKDKAVLVVAGYPKAILEELNEKGVEHFIHVRTNVLESLKSFQKLTGIE